MQTPCYSRFAFSEPTLKQHLNAMTGQSLNSNLSFWSCSAIFGVHGLSVSTWLPALSKAYKGTRSIVLKQRQSTQRYPMIWTGRGFCFSIKISPLPAWIFQTRLKGAFLGIPAIWWTLGCRPQSLLPGLQRVLTSILCLRFLTIFQFSHILG